MEDQSQLHHIGKIIIERYYSDFGSACCSLPRVVTAKTEKTKKKKRDGSAKPTTKSPFPQTQQSTGIHSDETKLGQSSKKSGETIKTGDSLTLSSSDKAWLSTIPEKATDKECCTVSKDKSQPKPASEQTPTSRDDEASMSMEKNEKKKLKEQKKKDKSQKKKTEHKSEPQEASADGDDGAKAVFSMCQTRLSGAFFIHGLKYNDKRHEIVRKFDAKLAELIQEEYSNYKPNVRKSQTDKKSKYKTVPKVEADFIIFHPTKGLLVGEVALGKDRNEAQDGKKHDETENEQQKDTKERNDQKNDDGQETTSERGEITKETKGKKPKKDKNKDKIKKAKEHLHRFQPLMKAVARRCGLENQSVNNKLIFLPFETEQPRMFDVEGHQDPQEFSYIRENSSWWHETSEQHHNITRDILYILVGLYATFVEKEYTENMIAADDQIISALDKFANISLVSMDSDGISELPKQ